MEGRGAVPGRPAARAELLRSKLGNCWFFVKKNYQQSTKKKRCNAEGERGRLNLMRRRCSSKTAANACSRAQLESPDGTGLQQKWYHPK